MPSVFTRHSPLQPDKEIHFDGWEGSLLERQAKNDSRLHRYAFQLTPLTNAVVELYQTDTDVEYRLASFETGSAKTEDLWGLYLTPRNDPADLFGGGYISGSEVQIDKFFSAIFQSLKDLSPFDLPQFSPVESFPSLGTMTIGVRANKLMGFLAPFQICASGGRLPLPSHEHLLNHMRNLEPYSRQLSELSAYVGMRSVESFMQGGVRSGDPIVQAKEFFQMCRSVELQKEQIHELMDALREYLPQGFLDRVKKLAW